MDERSFLLLDDVSVQQWIAFIGFTIATIGFFVWVAILARKKH